MNRTISAPSINPLNAEFNAIWHLLALLGAHHIPHVSRLRVNLSISMLFRILHILSILTGLSPDHIPGYPAVFQHVNWNIWCWGC